MSSAVEISNLFFSYGQKSVLENVNIKFASNRFSVLLGANGSGKSTFFKLVGGLLKGYRGKIFLHQKDSARLLYKHRAPLIGFLPQFHASVFPFTVQEILLTGRTAFSGFSSGSKDKELLNEVLAKLGISHLQHHVFTKLSGGEQQMVMVGRLLMQSPKIILMDEPINHLDVYHQHYLMHELQQYSRNGHSIITIMHNPTLAYQYADDIYFMQEKGITGSSAKEPDMEMLKKIYGTNFLTIAAEKAHTVLPVRL